MKNTIKGLCICAAMAAALAVQAADPGTTFLTVDAGLSLVEDVNDTEMDPGFRIDVAGGYNFTPDFALQLETGWIWNKLDIRGDAELNQIPILASVTYSIPLESRFKPYVGAGVGGVFSVLAWDNADDDIDTEEDFTFAYQLQAGVNYEVSERLDIGLGYKFLGSLEPEFGDVETDDIYTHAILAVFKIHF